MFSCPFKGKWYEYNKYSLNLSKHVDYFHSFQMISGGLHVGMSEPSNMLCK